ncbi:MULTISPECIES: aspartyl-phosphate phosphatase Spo0E family protein [unclassified Paenibacillus]|nr:MULTISPECIES: aspartyl-phosphate phosphatase Spo0E family protein [unclassified Paenibacillus]
MELLLLEKIEALRIEMVEEAYLRGSFTHEKVVDLSQKLDQYIVNFQELK